MRYYIVSAVSVVMCISLVAVAEAYAEPEWLIGGAAVTTLSSVQSTGLVTFTNLKASFLGASAVDCEGTLVGSVGAAGEGEITEVVGSEGKKTKGNGLTGEFVECKGVEGCEGNGLVYPLGMPWLTKLELSGTAILEDITPGVGTGMGYAIECSIFGIKEEDECTQALFGPTMENMASENDVLGIVAEENASHCSLSGENSGDAKGEFLTAVLSGTLAISGE